MAKTILFAAAAALAIVFAGCGGTSAPPAPKNLTVTDTSPITLSWDNVSEANRYNVYRGTASGGLLTKTRVASEITETTYTDMSTVQGTTYYYQVTAVDSNGGVSDPSNEVNVVSQAQPGGSFVLGGVRSASGIDLNWSNVSGAISYNVYRGTISAIITNKARIAIGILTTTYTDTDVTSGITYFYQVTAVNASGIETEVTNEASVTF